MRCDPEFFHENRKYSNYFSNYNFHRNKTVKFWQNTNFLKHRHVIFLFFFMPATFEYLFNPSNKKKKTTPFFILITLATGFSWTTNPDNWLYKNETEEPLLCGNVTGARHCPITHTCLCTGDNPNHGYTSFDNFLWSMLTTFQLITLDYWENVYNMVSEVSQWDYAVKLMLQFLFQVLSSCGPISVSFFTVVVFFGSFYLINLMLAVVALSYEEEAEITLEVRMSFFFFYSNILFSKKFLVASVEVLKVVNLKAQRKFIFRNTMNKYLF